MILPRRVERHQCLDLLRTIAYAEPGTEWKHYQSIGGWRNKHSSILGRISGHLVH